jgi:hypothetical protein
MTATPKTKRKIPTVAEVLIDQKKQAETSRALVPTNAAPVPASASTGNGAARKSWLEQDDGPRRVKFNGQLGTFNYADTKDVIPADIKFIARCDNVQVGRVKFNGAGSAPDKRGEIWTEQFVDLPPREELGDLDQSKWELGLDGQPRDPWLEFVELILLQGEDVCCFGTQSVTGIRAVRTLLKHYVKLKRKWNGRGEVYPIVQLVPGSYKKGVQTVHVPTFAICGETSTADPSTPASRAEDLGDEIAF